MLKIWETFEAIPFDIRKYCRHSNDHVLILKKTRNIRKLGFNIVECTKHSDSYHHTLKHAEHSDTRNIQSNSVKYVKMLQTFELLWSNIAENSKHSKECNAVVETCETFEAILFAIRKCCKH